MLYSQYFSQYVLWLSSGVSCRTQELIQNLKLNPLFNPHGGVSNSVNHDRVRHETPEEGWRTYQPKHYEYNNKDENNSPNILSDKNLAFVQLFILLYLVKIRIHIVYIVLKHKIYTVFRVNTQTFTQKFWGNPHGVIAKGLDSGLKVKEFELQSCCYIHFQTNTLGEGINPYNFPTIG